MTETAQDIIARIRVREQERVYLLDQLDLWAKTQAQGIDPDTVRGFGFDGRLLTEKQKRDFHRRMGTYIETLPSGRKRPALFNCVWHYDGSQTILDPMLKAVYRPIAETARKGTQRAGASLARCLLGDDE